jgi:hypothetical protein
VRHHEAGPGPPVGDQVAELPVVALDVGLAGANPQALLEQLADGDEQQAVPGVLVDAARVGRHVQAGHAEGAGRPHRLHELVQHGRRLFTVAGPGGGLVSDRVDALVGALAAGEVLDLGDGIAGGEVDRYRPDLGRLGEPLGDAVDHEDTRRAAEEG